MVGCSVSQVDGTPSAFGRRGWVFVGIVVVVSILGCHWPHAATQDEAAAAVDLQLPSASTGVAGGTLAVRLFPPSGTPRFPEGAPVIVACQGGTAPGDLKNPFPPTLNDVVVVAFLLPGGRQGEFSSSGTYDDRGEQCIAAVRDVVLFAGGRLADKTGKTIGQLCPVPVVTANVGLIGLSNGGNIVVAAAARHGADLAGTLRYLIQWESPVSSQMATVDLGGHKLIDGVSHAVDFESVNPRYLDYGALEASVYTADIRYNPSGVPCRAYHDGNGDGVYTTAFDPASGSQLPDLDHDGVLEMDEDFPLGAYSQDGRTVFSRAVTRALETNGAFSGTWPADILTVAEADAFWDLREAVRLYAAAARALPGMEAMVVAGVRDHVQGRPDKPHIRQAFEGWNDLGRWVQINPDPAYLVEILPSLEGRGDLPHNPPNTPPADWAAPETYCHPRDVAAMTVAAAGVRQMADRAASPTSEEAPYITFIPFITQEMGWQTELEAVNTTGTEQALRVELEDAGVVATLEKSVPGSSAIRLPLLAGVCGRVESTSPAVAMKVVYRLNGFGITLDSPLPKRVAKEMHLLTPESPASALWSGIALMNAGEGDNAIRLDAYGPDGAILESRSFIVPARSGCAFMQPQLFPAANGVLTRVRLSGTLPLHALMISATIGGAVLCTGAQPLPEPTVLGVPTPVSSGLAGRLVFDNPLSGEATAEVASLTGGVESAQAAVVIAAGGRATLDLAPFFTGKAAPEGLRVRFGGAAAFVRLVAGWPGAGLEPLLTGSTAHRAVLPLAAAPGRGTPVLFNGTGIKQRVRLTVQSEAGPQGAADLALPPWSRTALSLETLFPSLSSQEAWLTVSGQGGLAAWSDQGSGFFDVRPAAAAPITPVYLTLFSHNEDSWQSFVANRAGYEQYRADLLERLHLVADAGAVLDWQSDWAVLDAMARFENGALLDATHGKNIVRYLVEDLGFSADPHGHLIQYNYADIAHLFRQLGVEPSPVVGGALWATCGSGGQLLDWIDWREDAEIEADGWVRGRVFQQAFWKPEILSVPAFGGHWFDEMSSGVWKPGVKESFYLHDSTREIVYVGQGDPHDQTLLGPVHASPAQIFSSQGSFVRELASKLRAGALPDGQIHTASLHIRDKTTPDAGGAPTNERLREMLAILAPNLDAGEVVSVTYPEAAALWRDVYASAPGRTDIREYSRFPQIEQQIKTHCGATVPKILFSVNVHDWPLAADSIRTVSRILDIHEKYDVPVDVYLTDPIVQAYVREAPALLDRLRTSDQAVVSYHIRPPSPYYWTFDFLDLGAYPPDQRHQLLVDYETHALDLVNGAPGEGPGGYAYLAALMGYPPPVVSGFSHTGAVGEDLLGIFDGMGADLFVIHGRVVEPGEMAGPLYVRPEHVEIKLYEHPEKDPGQWIRDELQPWAGQAPVYVNLKVHENNFYLWGTSWDRIFYGQSGHALSPPFDLNAYEGTLHYRTEAEQAAQWASYEAAVAYVAAWRYNYHAEDCWDVLKDVGVTEQK